MDKLQMYLYKFIGNFIKLFPYNLRYKILDVLGIFFYLLIKKRREITKKNIKIAFPNLNENEINRLAKKSFKNITKNFLELVWSDEIYRRNNIKFEGKEILNRYKDKSGAILLSLHTGNWEMGAFLGKEGYDLYNVVKRQKNRHFDKLINDLRERNGGKSLYANKRSLQIIKALKRSGMVALISDQHVKDVEVTFFNKKTYAPSGAATLALKYKMPVILTYDIRKDDDSHVIIVEKELEIIDTGDLKNDIQTNTQNFINEFERVIKKYPEQWFWQHNRWK